MKRVLYLGIIVLLASCSSSKYAAHFQKSAPDYGYGELLKPVNDAITPIAESSNFVASTSDNSGIITTTATPEQTIAIEQIRRDYQQLSKSEKREFKKGMKNQIRHLVKINKKAGVESVAAVQKTKQMDHNLKLAAIFGAVGIVGLLIGGNAFWIIGGIALIIGVVFFVMWLVNQ
jgi:hypothetical protein